MERIKIVQIGTAHDHAGYVMNNLRKLSDSFEVVGVVEPNESFNYRLKEDTYKGIPVLTIDEAFNIDGLQAVAIETSEKEGSKYAIEAAKRGLAIHLDKPGAYFLEDFKELVQICKQTSAPLNMGYMYRFNPMVKECLRQVKQGELGEIFSVEAQMSVRHTKEKREWLGNFDGGMMYFLGCHLLDLCLQIQGCPQKIIPFNRCTKTENQTTCEDFGFAVLEYENGISFIKTNAAEVNGFERRQLVVTGTKGSFEIKPIEIEVAYDNSDSLMISKAHITHYDENANVWRDSGYDLESQPYNRYKDMLIEFYKIAMGQKQNPYSYDYELKLFELLLKCCDR